MMYVNKTNKEMVLYLKKFHSLVTGYNDEILNVSKKDYILGSQCSDGCFSFQLVILFPLGNCRVHICYHEKTI